MESLSAYTHFFEEARTAARTLAGIGEETIVEVLQQVAKAAVAGTPFLLEENRKDLQRMDPSDPRYDRLKLSEQRIRDIADDIVNVSKLPNPLGRVLSEQTLANGLRISKVSVPLGVVGVIYEARPNVTFDVFSLCFKTRNVSVLKGGSDASYSNAAIISLIHRELDQQGLNRHICILLPPERQATEALLKATGYIDVLIPRGSQQLIDRVRSESRVPVIETGAGIVHTYFDESADIQKGKEIIRNAKTRRVSVCNALDCLIVHRSRLGDLPELLRPLAAEGVEIYADGESYAALDRNYPKALLQHARKEHFGTEFLSLRMAVKTVGTIQDALDHIAAYSSKHSEAILTEDEGHATTFLNQVDAAAVYVNASTAFTDGAQFGLGAEIGISTQKLHARGPMGLEELTSYKWLVRGEGQIRKP